MYKSLILQRYSDKLIVPIKNEYIMMQSARIFYFCKKCRLNTCLVVSYMSRFLIGVSESCVFLCVACYALFLIFGGNLNEKKP